MIDRFQKNSLEGPNEKEEGVSVNQEWIALQDEVIRDGESSMRNGTGI